MRSKAWEILVIFEVTQVICIVFFKLMGKIYVYKNYEQSLIYFFDLNAIMTIWEVQQYGFKRSKLDALKFEWQL